MGKITESLEVLLVEDNPDDAMLAKMALEESKIVNSIVHLKDGAEALDYIFREGTYANQPADNKPKIILLDLKMPKINGLEVLRRLKSSETTKKIPVIMFTSSDEDPDVKECYNLGVNSYIVKPMDFEKFKNTVNNIGLYWLVLNRAFE
jgi:two-component system, response regulator